MTSMKSRTPRCGFSRAGLWMVSGALALALALTTALATALAPRRERRALTPRNAMHLMHLYARGFWQWPTRQNCRCRASRRGSSRRGWRISPCRPSRTTQWRCAPRTVPSNLPRRHHCLREPCHTAHTSPPTIPLAPTLAAQTVNWRKFKPTNRPTHALFEALTAACAAKGVLVVTTANDEGHVEIARAEPGPGAAAGVVHRGPSSRPSRRASRVRRACARADGRALARAEHQWTGRHLESLNLVR
jgi:hypothetical protein